MKLKKWHHNSWHCQKSAQSSEIFVTSRGICRSVGVSSRKRWTFSILDKNSAHKNKACIMNTARRFQDWCSRYLHHNANLYAVVWIKDRPWQRTDPLDAHVPVDDWRDLRHLVRNPVWRDVLWRYRLWKRSSCRSWNSGKRPSSVFCLSSCEVNLYIRSGADIRTCSDDLLLCHGQNYYLQ